MVGFVLLGIISFDLYDNFKYLKSAIKGYGEIISIEPVDIDGKHIRKIVEVQYLTKDSRLCKVKLPDYVFDSSVWGGRYYLSEGKSVTFLYDPNNPQEVRPLQVSDQYPWSEILLILASLIPIYSGLRILKKAKVGIY